VIGKRKFIYDLWGDTVNVASRMESHGLPGAIQLSDASRRLLDGKYQLRSRGLIEVKGKGEMETWLLSPRL
jgi:class 3 adenylate cyclase